MKFVSLDQKAIGRDLKRAREHLGISVKNIADESGVAASHIWNLENGIKEMSLEKFFVLCPVLGLSCGRVLADNLQIDQEEIRRIALEQVKGIKLDWGKREALQFANYVSGCAVVTIRLLMTGERFVMERGMTFPTDDLRDAFVGLEMRIVGDMKMDERRGYLKAIQESPWAGLKSLGMMNQTLFDGFDKAFAIRGKEPKPWNVELPRSFEREIAPSDGLFSMFDPLALGRNFRKVHDQTGTAFKEDLLDREKALEKAVSLIRPEYHKRTDKPKRVKP